MNNFDMGSLASVLGVGDLTKGVVAGAASQNWGTLAEAKELIETIERCSELETLNLEGNTLGVEAAKGIAKALTNHPELKNLLIKDLFTGRLKTEIPLALRSLGEGIITATANLVVIDCGDNALGPNGLVGLVDLLKSRSCYSLQELKLNNCGLGITGGKMLAKALLECYEESVKHSPNQPFQLKTFIAGRNRLEIHGSIALAKVFKTLGSLEVIEMPQNGIYHPGIGEICKSLHFNRNMRVLNLNDNTINLKGAYELQQALYVMDALEELNLGDCLLKTKGVNRIANAIGEAVPNLSILRLGHNEIGCEGGEEIALAVCEKDKFTLLDLDGNRFGEAGRNKITDILSGRNSIDCTMESDDSDGDDDDDDNENENEVGSDGDIAAAADDDDDDEDRGGGGGNGGNRDDSLYHDDDEVPEDDDDDNGDDDYDEDDEYEDEHENEDVGEDHVKPVDDEHLDISVFETIDYNELPMTIEIFCGIPHPTADMFNRLENNDVLDAIRKYLKDFTADDDYIINLCFIILKCSDIYKDCASIKNICIELYRDCFIYAEENQQFNRIIYFFLIQLGLLKTEVDNFTPLYNTKSGREILKMAINEGGVCKNDTYREQILCFLNFVPFYYSNDKLV